MSEQSPFSSSISVSCSCDDFTVSCPHQQDKRSYINPVARVLLSAVLLPSPRSQFGILAKCPDLVETIYQHVKEAWLDSLTPGCDDVSITTHGNVASYDTLVRPELLSRVSLCRISSHLKFPEPKGLVCNMLPFLVEDLNSVPSEYHGYLPIIRACRRYIRNPGRVWYLTIQESQKTSYGPQRRGGIHVEGFLARPAKSCSVPLWHPWGMGLGSAEFTGGIFHMSNISHSCRMWNTQVPRKKSALLGIGCDLEHLRGVLNEFVEPVYPKANQLYWMTDATPHESLDLVPGTYRQYFRLVTSEIGAWWEKHSTENRLGIMPDCRVLKHSKFDKDAYVGFDDIEGNVN